MIKKKNCPICLAASNTVESKIGSLKILNYTCGHYESVKEDTPETYIDFVSKSGNKPYKYQIEGSVFAVNSASGRVLIADEMGLGKTVQACMIVSKHKKELGKYLVVCKSSIRIQWMQMLMDWAGFITQPIDSENEFIINSVDGYIISYDLLHGSDRISKKTGKRIVKGIQDLETLVKKLGVSTVILDEVQHIKNWESKRTQAVCRLVRLTDYIIALSGTPIKNNQEEYFPILHMLYPERFPNRVQFDRKYLNSYFNGYANKTLGWSNFEAFQRDTADFVIRRTRIEVLPDLPVIQRNNQFCELGPVVEEAYKQTLKEFVDYQNSDAGLKANAAEISSCILAYLSKMRHLTGLAKVEPVVEYVYDFLQETDRKIIIFLHHKDVAGLVKEKISNLLDNIAGNVLEINSAMTAQERYDAVQNFRKDSSRVIICSTLAAGEGIDGLQIASDVIFMERQWNPANEEQAESRIIRIGQLSNNLTATYFIAIGTVDEFFAELVEKKRAMIAKTLNNEDIKWDQSSLMKDLADILIQTGGKKWGF